MVGKRSSEIDHNGRFTWVGDDAVWKGDTLSEPSCFPSSMQQRKPHAVVIKQSDYQRLGGNGLAGDASANGSRGKAGAPLTRRVRP
jgi:hypothetical protein